MARKGKAVNRRKSSPGGKKSLVALVVVALLIALSIFLLERFRSVTPPPAKVDSGSAQHLPIPERHPVQQQMTTASVPVPTPQAAPAKRQKGPGRVAIIIDDMGSSMQELQTLLSIKLPITYSIIPSLQQARRVAEKAHEAGAEVMVHMPMEPEGYPKQRLESIGVLVAMDDEEIARRVNDYFQTVPHAVGANNHMGSRFTQHAGKMEVVLKVLKEKGVYFVDSRTSSASVAYKTSKALGLKSGTRQVFLDNVQEEGAIGRQLAEAVAIARKRGAAIAICHPHPSTLRALKMYMPQHAESGITFVFASELTS